MCWDAQTVIWLRSLRIAQGGAQADGKNGFANSHFADPNSEMAISPVRFSDGGEAGYSYLRTMDYRR